MLRKNVYGSSEGTASIISGDDESTDFPFASDADTIGGSFDSLTSDSTRTTETASAANSNSDYLKTKYKKLRNIYEDDGFSDLQFEKIRKPKVPWKAILFACILFVAGTVAIAVASLSLTGHITSNPTDVAFALMVLGLLMFIPGSYHVRLAYCAFKDYPGYTWDAIPDFD